MREVDKYQLDRGDITRYMPRLCRTAPVHCGLCSYSRLWSAALGSDQQKIQAAKRSLHQRLSLLSDQVRSPVIWEAFRVQTLLPNRCLGF